jgi:hypothetical protein
MLGQLSYLRNRGKRLGNFVLNEARNLVAIARKSGSATREAQSGSRRNKSVINAVRSGRMPGLLRQDHHRLDFDVAEGCPQLVDIASWQPFLPDEDCAAPAQLSLVNPGTELELAMDDYMRMV